MNEPCAACPFGPNRVKHYGTDTLERAISVANELVTTGNLQPNQPQLCHKKATGRRNSYVVPLNPDEECVGHRQYINKEGEFAQ